MLKKIVACSCVFFATNVFAIGAPYLGLKASVNSASYSLRNAGATTNYSSNGETGGVIAGFGADLQDGFYLAAELFAEGGSIRTSVKTINAAGTTAKIRPQWDWGFGILPGYRYGADGMWFLRIGGVRGQFGLTQTTGSVKTETETLGNGLQVGGGIQLTLSNSVLLRGEYSFTNYYSIHSMGSAITTRNNQVSLSLLYRFL